MPPPPRSCTLLTQQPPKPFESQVREEDISTAVNRAILSNFGDFGAGLCHAG